MGKTSILAWSAPCCEDVSSVVLLQCSNSREFHVSLEYPQFVAKGTRNVCGACKIAPGPTTVGSLFASLPQESFAMKKLNLISLSAVTLCLFAGGQATASSTTLPGPGFPQFKDPAAIKAACDVGLKGAGKKVKALEKHSPKAWLAAYDDLTAFIEDVANPIDFAQNVYADGALRDAAQACSLRWSEFSSTLGQNEKLYKTALKVKPVDKVESEFLRVTLQSFEVSGVGLPKARRERAKQINDQITALDQKFSKNLREAGVKVEFTQAELDGVPEAVWKNAKRSADGKISLGVDYPSYLPVIQNAKSETARERMWRAKTNEGGQTNLDILGQITQLRLEYAKLFGFESYADFALKRKMAKTTSNAMQFLDEVKGTVRERELRDIAELRDAKALETKTPNAQINRWDTAYYTEVVRRAKYSVDEESFRPFFPPQESLSFALHLIEKMMGVKYTRVQAPTWHEEVQAYAVSDAATGKALAAMYVDLYPRDGKYNHAAVWPLRSSSTRLQRVPQASLVVNFNRKGLTIDELQTLLHELGHAVHNNLSATRFASQGGTTVLHDFVEAPSQMLEEWVYDKKVLALMANVCASCKPVPDELLAKAVAARDFGKGTQVARQHLYASYDLALHSALAPEPMATWATMEGATPLGYVKNTQFPAGFSHLAGSYGAGYYGYLWSLVIAMDLRTAFAADKLDPKFGMGYRTHILQQGSERAPGELVHDFLGRDTNSKAFYDYLRK